MTCKQCIHYGICIWTQVETKKTKVCNKFKNKADFVEVVRCEKCAYRKSCGQQIYLEGSYTSIGMCDEGIRERF
jgi:hypothetical protein